MTDLNEKLKLVAFYDGKSLHQKNDGKIFIHNELSFDLAIYHTSYDWQIPVWQKVVAAMRETMDGYNPKGISEHDFKIMQFDTDYSEQINNGTPLESFEILVQAIQFINNLKKK